MQGNTRYVILALLPAAGARRRLSPGRISTCSGDPPLDGDQRLEVSVELAMAEREGGSGAELLAAVTLGYDVCCRFVLALGPDQVRGSQRSGEHNALIALSTEPKPDEIVAGLGTRFFITETSIKPYSVGYPIQAPLDAFLTLLREHKLTADNMERISVRLRADGGFEGARRKGACATHPRSNADGSRRTAKRAGGGNAPRRLPR
jgi:hypothetical protein